MPKRGDEEFLLDIIEAIRRIELYTKGLNYADFLKKMETQDAVVRNFEIIGEAVKNISKTLKAKNKDILNLVSEVPVFLQPVACFIPHALRGPEAAREKKAFVYCFSA
jgi:hypothetical protein